MIFSQYVESSTEKKTIFIFWATVQMQYCCRLRYSSYTRNKIKLLKSSQAGFYIFRRIYIKVCHDNFVPSVLERRLQFLFDKQLQQKQKLSIHD